MENPRLEFFEELAQKWDTFEDLSSLHEKLVQNLGRFAIGENDSILDIGCGTGNLTLALLSKLGPEGRVIAVDFSAQMLAMARSKISDPRVTFLQCDASSLTLPDSCADHAFCFGVWPHFDDHNQVALEMLRVLRPNGRLHVWHHLSRTQVNAIHSSAGAAVRNDELVPAIDTAVLLTMCGFGSTQVYDRDDAYLVTATKPSSGLLC